jgi:hypothetical protein
MNRRFGGTGLLWAATALLASALAGCGGGSGGGGRGPVATATPVGPPTGAVVSKTIGVAGGEVTSGDGNLKVTVPAGALAADTDIGIQPVENKAFGGLGSGYRLTPDGQDFTQPVTLAFTYTDADLVGTAPEALGVAFQTPEGYWQLAADISVDTGAKTVSATTRHFTDWGYVEQFRINPAEKVVTLGEAASFQVEMCFPVRGEPDAQGVRPTLGADCGPFAVSIAGLILANWSVNGVPGGDSVHGTVFADVDRGGYQAPATAPDTCVVALSVDLKDLNDKSLKAMLVANITILGCLRYQGPIDFSLAAQNTVGTSTVTWKVFENQPDVRRFLPSGDLDVTISLTDCDTLHTSLPIESGTPSLPIDTLVVYTGGPPFGGRYQFALSNVPQDLTFSCGDPREQVTIEHYIVSVPVGICDGGVADMPEYTDLSELKNDGWGCAFTETTANWDFKQVTPP